MKYKQDLTYMDTEESDGNPECPYCKSEFEYYIEGSLPENETLECRKCKNVFSVSAEPCISWTSSKVAEIQLLEDWEDFKKDDILKTSSSEKGDRYGTGKWIFDKEMNRDMPETIRAYAIHDFHSKIPVLLATWLGYPID